MIQPVQVNREEEKKKVVPITKEEARRLGLPENIPPYVPFIEDLRKQTPSIVIGECVSKHGDVLYQQNKSFTQSLKKKKEYVMSVAVYQQLHFDPRINHRVLRPSETTFSKMYKPYNGQDLSNKTLLVMRTGGIGDLLFIQPNLIYLQEKYPSCKIIMACSPQYKPMVETWDCIDKVVDLPVESIYFKRSHYHAIFEGVIERCREAERVNAYKLFTEWMGLDLPEEKLIPNQEVDNDSLDDCINILNKWRIKEKEFIVIQMRASSPLRTPRLEFWKEIIDRLTDLGHNVVLTDSRRNWEVIQEFIIGKELRPGTPAGISGAAPPEVTCEEDLKEPITGLKNQEKIFNYAEYSELISNTIALISLSKMVISVDSATPHIAASLGIPIFGVFGSFPGKIRLSTYKNCDWIDAEYECSPCFRHGQKLCEKSRDGFPNCFDQLNIDLCIEKIEKVMNNV